MILGNVVQQRGDRLVFVAAVVENQRRDAQEVRHVWRVTALPGLAAVSLDGVADGYFEPLAEQPGHTSFSRGARARPICQGPAAGATLWHGRADEAVPEGRRSDY